MELGLANQQFIVSGASSGLGKAIAIALAKEQAKVIAVARGITALKELQDQYPEQITIIEADITQIETIDIIKQIIGNSIIHGIVVNAGGPPAKTALETTLQDWDDAYKNILRWKVALTQAFITKMTKAAYGRIIFIESSSIKQPLENLVLSTSLRLAVVGFVKTLSQEVAANGITLNVLAPGSHNTPAINRIYQKKSEQTGLLETIIREKAIEQIPVKRLGEADDFASLALWLLSKYSGYVTGQTISVDGGAVKGTF
ncbi:MAG: SDR family oxidoreductase [Chitinophagaceae bacterium]